MKTCTHLDEIIKHELIRGNIIVSDDDKWSSGIRVITFKDAIDIQYVDSQIYVEQVEYWENHDSHYPIQKGYICKKCNISIASPIKKI